ncbi:MAG TPA: sulfatase-like hydrolase/transferase, partial [Vicinamibacterales bacterium]|nr:sulfatase-like hydrolase/transferase [Vicinamibacterales bacterium]
PVTTVSHATLLTGSYPAGHRVNDFGAPLPGTVPYLPQLLRDAGYRTAAFVGSLILDPRNGTAPGFDRGFDVYDAGFRLRRPGDDRYRSVERRGEEVVTRALAWSQQPASERASFLWVHLFDPHDPYDPPADLKARFAASPYDGEIAAVDRLVGRLVQSTSPDTIVAVAADHGESLGDHGEETHGVFLYDAVMHVPLVIRIPGAGAGTGIDTRVRLADVAPTLLEAAGLPVPRAMQGETLMPLVRANSPTAKTTDRPVYAETEYPRRAFGWSPLAAWRNDRFLLVRAPKPELYDLVADPGATNNLAATRPRVLDGMSAELRDFIVRSAEPASPRLGDDRPGEGGPMLRTGRSSEGAKADPELAKRLASLGYVSGGSTSNRTGVDPKGRIAIANALHQAVVAVEDGAFQKAIPLLEKVTASEPDIPLALLQLGIARVRTTQHARAIAPLTRLVSLDPDQLFGQYELGIALYETGDLQGAARHLAIVAGKMPEWADARYSLGSVYARIDRVADATTELRAALALEPRHFRANLLLGRILTLQNQANAAIPLLRTAVEVDPKSAEAKAFLDEAMRRKTR